MTFLFAMAGAAAAGDSTKAVSPEEPVEGTFVYVKMETSMGDIILELDSGRAPISVANFLQYANKGFYDSTIFHRVIPTFMVQGGGFTADMVRKITDKPITNEWQNGLKNGRGTIAMARRGRMANSATSQFFINVVDNKALDVPRDGAGYAVFGRVFQGMDIIDKIRVVETHTVGGQMVDAVDAYGRKTGKQVMKGGRPDVPVEPIYIVSITRIAKPQP
jgi:peptidyl-prolyl cis-trans isomerase A (cyclophilin A)